tara:strand:+ start:191 stop:1627 length:1437 start_codon:yes stop_codon:yes gene_type:complete
MFKYLSNFCYFIFFFISQVLICQSITFADSLNTISYSNNDGTNIFMGNWVENGDGGTDPANGRIRIVSGQLRINNMDSRSIRRNLDLSSYTNTVLTLDYERTGGDESINVQLNNGTGFVTVSTLTGTGSLSYILDASEMSATSEIRFVGADTSWGWDDVYVIDNILFTADLPDQPPLVVGSGNQVYCPGSSRPVAQTISITDPDDTTTTAVYIQISGGYVNGEDLLTLTGSHPNITATWDAVQGELTLQGPATYGEFESAVLASEYTSSSPNPFGTRQFSITVGEANFLPSTNHYYEFIADPGITWTQAEIAASNRFYFGLQGYLVTLTSQEEANFSGSQAQGVGWIGANDAAVEGEWRWVTGPEAGTQFWNGDAGGTELTFAFWNAGEPNDYPNPGISGEENYAHITDPSVTSSPGSWNDLPNVTDTSGAYSAQGYVVEYGGMLGDPALNITATTSITMSSCKVITNRSITYRVKRN